jgi:sugar lactone lactonase YvrE
VTTGNDPEVVVALGAELGEGPVWDARSGRLVWVDILGRRIHATDPATGETQSMDTPLHVGAVAPRAGGGFVAALQNGFWVVGDGPARLIREVAEARPGLRFNDGKCDPAGRFWAGTMAYDGQTGAGSLYRLDGQGGIACVIGGVTISNGLAWSRDGSTMYYVDSPLRRIDAFTYDSATGEATERRTTIRIPPEQGTPDGMTIDEDDGLWVVLPGAGAVHRYVDGRLDAVVRLPVSHPTSCTFGDADLGTLFITSAREDFSPAERAAQPLAGALFRVRPGFRGRLPDVFIGG